LHAIVFLVRLLSFAFAGKRQQAFFYEVAWSGVDVEK
jgi:hypothetical protein